MRLKPALVVLSMCVVPSLGAQESLVRGVVFADTNGNGARDRGERGISGIVVSNQDAVVTTDASGAYSIAPGVTGIVFVSVPDGYRAVGSFWRSTTASAASSDFALRPVPRVKEFTFVHASDHARRSGSRRPNAPVSRSR